MRTKTATVAKILSNTSHIATRVVVVIGGVSPLPDDVIAVEISQDVDSPCTAKVTIRRQYGMRSQVPIISSAWTVGAAITISFACSPADIDGGASEVFFQGFVDDVAFPNDEMEVTATDKWAKLRDTFIERERCYGLAQGTEATKGALIWVDPVVRGWTWAVNDLVLPSEAKRNGYYYKVTSIGAGSEPSTEPFWPILGSTVVNGDITFTKAGTTSNTTGVAIEVLIPQILSDNGLASFTTMSTPVSPGWQVKPFLQQRQSVQDAMKAITDQLGWTLQFKWSIGYGAFVLFLEQPDRAGTSTVRTFRRDEEIDLSEAKISVFDIRNVVAVTYADVAKPSAEGRNMRVSKIVTDAASVAKYGRRFMEIQEDDASNIDTSAEAAAMANAALADLADPLMNVSYKVGIDPYLQLGDRVLLPADNLRWSADQRLAIVGYTHRIGENGSTTDLALAGKPVSQKMGWLALDGRLDAGAGFGQLTSFNGTDFTVSARTVVGGTLLTVTQTNIVNGALDRSYEFHVSATSGFTPDASTLKGSGRMTSLVIGDLVPGKVYYAKIIPISVDERFLTVRGGPSDEISFTAGQAQSAHYSSKSTQTFLPLNGNFEHFTDDQTLAPPDHWTVQALGGEPAESWGASGSVYFYDDSTHGKCIRLRPTAARGRVVSSAFEIRRGTSYVNVYTSAKKMAGTVSLVYGVMFYSDYALTTLTGSVSESYPLLTAWLEMNAEMAVPAGSNFAVVQLSRDAVGDMTDDVVVGDIFVETSGLHSAARIDALYAGTAALQALDVSTVTNLYGSVYTHGTTALAQEAWTAPTLNTGWVAFGPGWGNAAYFKDSMGIVHLGGTVKRTSGSDTTIFTLPSGYRPSVNRSFPSIGSDAAATIDALSTGVVRCGVGNVSVYLLLDGITFDTR